MRIKSNPHKNWSNHSQLRNNKTNTTSNKTHNKTNNQNKKSLSRRRGKVRKKQVLGWNLFPTQKNRGKRKM
jgi:hypothetical protein